MQGKRRLILFVTAFTVVFGFLTIAAPALAASKEKVLYSFGGYRGDGHEASSGLISDAAGNLYGVTFNYGAYGGGIVFQLAPGAGGTWSENILYNFCDGSGCPDGAYPTANLVFDAAGNLYGTTLGGGAYSYFGAVFELAPGAGGTWTETVLHSFNNDGKDGVGPQAGLIFDAAGNLYGTTGNGGVNGGGIVFELTPRTNGTWKEKVLHSFGKGNDGNGPYCSLIFDAAGHLYGTTTAGGAYGYGTVFKLTPKANGKWTEKILDSFNPGGKDGYSPVFANLIFDAAGKLYGTTSAGGVYGGGTVFALAPGTKKEKTLHSFGNGMDGNGPWVGLISDAAGNLYGHDVSGRCSCFGHGLQARARRGRQVEGDGAAQFQR